MSFRLARPRREAAAKNLCHAGQRPFAASRGCPSAMAAQVHQQDMKRHMTPRDCVAFILIKGDRVLAEKRKLTKQIDPGAIALPGGHMENGESPEEALYRESREELGIVPCSIKYICTLLHRAQELQRIHYFAVEVWEGNIENNEAESLRWVPIAESKEFDIDVDRIAMSEYLRVYAS